MNPERGTHQVNAIGGLIHMDIIVANVGMQPSAVAVAVNSWLHYTRQSEDRIKLILLHTAGTEGQAGPSR